MSFFDYKDDEGNDKHPLVPQQATYSTTTADVFIRWQEWTREVPQYNQQTGEKLESKTITGNTAITLAHWMNALGDRIQVIEARLDELDGLGASAEADNNDKETDDDE